LTFTDPKVASAYKIHAMNEHRKAQRQRTFKGGSISFDTAFGIDCLVRNISETGACLEVKIPARIPDDFTLIIKPEHVRRSCHVTWRTARLIGVRFA
jgi:hypothetical protein